MSKLVFVDSTASATAAYTFATNAAFNGNATGLIGIWSLDLGDHIGGASAAECLLNTSGIIPSRFMITQSTGTTVENRPYASGVIYREAVKRITFTPYLTGAKKVDTLTPVTGTDGTLEIKIVNRMNGHIFDYNEFVSPSSTSYARQSEIRRVSCAVASTDSATTICNNLRAAIVALNEGGNSPLPFVGSGTSTCIMTAKDFGDDYAMTVTQATGVTTGLAATTAAAIGVGTAKQALSDEQKYLGYKTGFHNRLHLPQTVTPLYADAAKTYDVITIEYYNAGDKGVKVGNDLCTAVLYIPSGWADGSSTLDLCLTGNIPIIASGGTAGVEQVLYVA
jgi:hypothetical protein